MQILVKSPSDPMLPPATNRLWVSPSGSLDMNATVSFPYRLQVVKSIPAIGKPNDKNYQAPSEVVTDVSSGNCALTDDQWKNWSAGGDKYTDEEYVLYSICDNLKLTPLE